MDDSRISKLRNIGIVAHIDAGKTTTTERILYYTGLTHKIGEVHEGTTIMDWMEQEQERGITITSAATTCHWKDRTINIIDTPGHVDFTVEVERSLRVLDGAIFILDAKEGVEAQTRVVWHQANHYHVPRMIFINKMDVIGADYYESLASIEAQFHIKPLPLIIPIGSEKEFEGVISLITMKAYYNEGNYGEELVETDIPSSYTDIALKYRNDMLEQLADLNEELMMAYLEGHAIEREMIQETIRDGTIEGALIPVLCGSAYKNKGIQLLLDATVDYLPSPEDIPYIQGHALDGTSLKRRTSTDEPFSALIFKIMTDPFVGRLSFLRIYSGSLHTGDAVLNVSKDEKVRATKLLLMHANTRTEIDEAYAGDIIAAIGFKYFGTGNTLSDMDHPILLESIDFPEPVLTLVVEPKRPSDFDKMYQAIEHLTEEDPTLNSYKDRDTGQTVLSGMGELHLEIVVDRLNREFGITVRTGKPQVAYKETITKTVTVDYELDISSGNQQLYAYVKIKAAPRERGLGHHVTSHLDSGKLPESYITAALTGIHQSLRSGLIGGYEVIDMKVELIDMKISEEHSSDVAFTTACAYCLTKALKEGESRLLEPFFTLSAFIPEEHIGGVMDDLQKRGGVIQAMGQHHNDQVITAVAPLASLFGYATDFRSITHGNGHYTMIFSHYDFK